jgi:hypothetical protein
VIRISRADPAPQDRHGDRNEQPSRSNYQDAYEKGPVPEFAAIDGERVQLEVVIAYEYRNQRSKQDTNERIDCLNDSPTEDYACRYPDDTRAL